jgi:hypothetical protein
LAVVAKVAFAAVVAEVAALQASSKEEKSK